MIKNKGLEQESKMHQESSPEKIKQAISSDLKNQLEMKRSISRGEWDEDPKTISVAGQDKKTYRVFKTHDEEGEPIWVIDIADEEGTHEETVHLTEPTDIKYIEKLFDQDISDNLRVALEENREVSYEDEYEDRYEKPPQRKFIRVKLYGNTYEFYQNNTEYARWTMSVNDEKDENFCFANIRESSDVEYLDKIFDQDIPDSLRHALEEKREVSYDERKKQNVIRVKHNGKKFKFFKKNSDWIMETYDENSELINSLNFCLNTDIQYLEKLIVTPTKDAEIKNLKDKL